MLSKFRVHHGSGGAHSDAGMASRCHVKEKVTFPQTGATLIYYY